MVKESSQGGLQLLTQGTADIILDCCDDFWSGKDLRPLREEERKRAQDFYQRNALVRQKIESFRLETNLISYRRRIALHSRTDHSETESLECWLDRNLTT